MKWLSLSALVVFISCGPSVLQVQAKAANELAMAADSVLPVLVRIYQTEGHALIEAASTQEEAEASLNTLRLRWRIVWGVCNDEQSDPGYACRGGAWASLVNAHGAWTHALERQIRGESWDVRMVTHLAHDMRAAYCDLQEAIPSGVQIPDVIRKGCVKE